MMATLMTLTLASAAGLPADAAENHRAPRGGVVAPGPQGEAALPALLKAMRADAARRSGQAAASLVVQPVEEVTWSDGALGCPQPGLVYTQALVPGWRVRIDSGTERLSYHASRRGQWLWCPAGQAQGPKPGAVSR